MSAHTSTRSMIAAVIVLACGTAAMADQFIASGHSSIRALAATERTFGYNYSGGATRFRTFTGPSDATFAAAQAAPNASTLTTGLHSSWLNSANNPAGWGNSVMNNAGARWIHNSTDANNNGTAGVSVLFAVPFYVASATTASITLSWVTDNGLGNPTGANGFADAGYTNAGAFVNGNIATPVSPTPSNGNQPGQFGSVNTTTYSNVSLNAGLNYFYFYQFNWGGPGGSAFVLDFGSTSVSTVPLPAPVFGGLAGLAGVGGLVAIRRRRMA